MCPLAFCVLFECGACEPDVFQPDIVHLLVTGTWLTSDFKVSTKPTTDPDSDGKVFGIPPSDGSLTFELQVDTTSLVGPFLPADTNVAHPFYGYTDVSLPCGAAFGTATWDTSSILAGLQGPDDSEAALWVNEDLNGNTPPTRASFRLFYGTGSAPGQDNKPDIFIGGVVLGTNYQLRDSQYLLWEYFGEEIRSDDFEFSFGEHCLY